MKFSENSLKKLSTCRPELRRVVELAIDLGIMDFAVTEGFRDEETQNRYFAEGKSKLQWPYGQHNKFPSNAVDLVPCIKGQAAWDKLPCCMLAMIILSVGKMTGTPLRWGGDWDSDGDMTDQKFMDYVHFEYIEKP